MLLAAAIWICIFFNANIALIIGKGQNYAERGYIHAGVGVTEDEDDFATDLYDWDHDGPEVVRWNVEDYPHPQLEPRACRRKQPSNVCDPDQILTEQEAEELDTLIRGLYNDTPCICDVCYPSGGGIQIGIALLRRTYKPYNEHPSKIIHSFARNLRSKWRLGQCEDDLLVVVATGDRQSYTSVGRSAQRYISHGDAYRIFLANKAHFSAGLYFEGLRDMLKDYREATSHLKQPPEQKELATGEIIGIVLALVLGIGLLLIIGVCVYKRCKNHEAGEKPKFGNGSKSSSWRRKDFHIPSFLSPRQTYGSCPTKDEAHEEKPKKIEDEEVINTDLAPPDVPAEPTTVTVNEEPPSSSTNGQNSQTVATPSTSDDSQRTTETANTSNGANMQTFVPKKSTELHQTDL